jgi:MFS family permease
MRATLVKLWPLFFSVVLIQLAVGVLSDLIGVRASQEGFPVWTIGPVLAGYYVGYSTAPFFSRRIIARIGHGAAIALSSVLAGLAVVALAWLIAPSIWLVLRFVIGFALSLGYVAIESWINDHVENDIRGRVFSIYTLIQLVAMTGSQGLFGAIDSRTVWLFLISGALLAAGAVPAFVSMVHQRDKPPPEHLHLADLFRASPLGAIATIVSGVSWAIIVSFGPIYALKTGLSQAETGIFMGAAMLGGLLLQFPLGWVSDHFGRRATVALMSAGAVAASLFGIWAGSHGALAQYATMLAIGGLNFTLYAISVSATNDAVAPQNRVAAAAGLVLLFGLGSIAGPLAGGWAFAHFGPHSYFILIAASMAASLAATAVTR